MMSSVHAEKTEDTARKDDQKAEETKQKNDKAKLYFKSINRMQYRYSFEGEHTFSQGAFIILPYGFNVAEIAEFYTDTDDSDPVSFKYYTLEAKLARYLNPEGENWGKAFSWVIRFQSASERDPRWSGGLQWNTRDTPLFRDLGRGLQWKMLFQAFFREEDEDGSVDLFHWYQFPWHKQLVYRFRGRRLL
jgi:hypothetical protein